MSSARETRERREGQRQSDEVQRQEELGRASVGNSRLTAATVLLGAVIVLLSQIVTGYTLVDETDSVIANVTLFETHGVIAALFALVAALALVFAIATGSRAAVAVVIAMGIGTVLVFLFIDLPDVGDTGLFNTPGAGNLDATGKASAGLWMQLVGGLVLILGGAALARLPESQLRAIGPKLDPGPDRAKKPGRPGRTTKPDRKTKPGGPGRTTKPERPDRTKELDKADRSKRPDKA
jgi:hypothetical protein